MTRAPQLPPAPDFMVEALAAVVEAHQNDGQNISEIFDEAHIRDTTAEIMQKSGLPLETGKERRAAARLTWYVLGAYARDNRII